MQARLVTVWQALPSTCAAAAGLKRERQVEQQDSQISPDRHTSPSPAMDVAANRDVDIELESRIGPVVAENRESLPDERAFQVRRRSSSKGSKESKGSSSTFSVSSLLYWGEEVAIEN